ncbi:MAG: isoprenoid biosynthesis glyoxalase ElbB [Phycisphaeraceae bacterium]|nr:isoprenoid biosynthesis glyoxalase ElbB [Phycisphaeraceae bacterium]
MCEFSPETVAAEHSVMQGKKVAVILCGSGRADGSEIHESVSVLIHLDRHGLNYRCFAPDLPQAEVVDHLTGKPTGEKRNMLVEAARIARGEISPLSRLDAREFDALAFPGGNGAAKNLFTFAKDGVDCSVNPDVAKAIKAFHNAGKPMAFACIAPVLAAKVLGSAAGGPGCEVTIGSDAGAAGAIAKMGARHAPKEVTQAHVDPENKIVTTPAYMCDTGPNGVFIGIGAMIDEVARLLEKRS